MSAQCVTCLQLCLQAREAGRTVALLHCLQRLATAGAAATSIVTMPGAGQVLYPYLSCDYMCPSDMRFAESG